MRSVQNMRNNEQVDCQRKTIKYGRTLQENPNNEQKKASRKQMRRRKSFLFEKTITIKAVIDTNRNTRRVLLCNHGSSLINIFY